MYLYRQHMTFVILEKFKTIISVFIRTISYVYITQWNDPFWLAVRCVIEVIQSLKQVLFLVKQSVKHLPKILQKLPFQSKPPSAVSSPSRGPSTICTEIPHGQDYTVHLLKNNINPILIVSKSSAFWTFGNGLSLLGLYSIKRLFLKLQQKYTTFGSAGLNLKKIPKF